MSCAPIFINSHKRLVLCSCVLISAATLPFALGCGGNTAGSGTITNGTVTNGGTTTSSAGSPNSATVAVTINSAEQHQKIEGFGAGINNWLAPSVRLGCSPPVDLPEQVKTQILDMLYGDLGLTTVQVGFNPGGSADLSAVLPLLPMYSAIAQRVQDQGDRLAYNFYGSVPAQLRDSRGRLLPNAAAVYSASVANDLVQLKSQGLSVDLWNIQEEPDGAGNLSPAELHQLVTATGAQFQMAGLSTRIAIPRTTIVGDVPAYAIPILSDPLSRPFVPQLDYHEYDYDASIGQTPDISGRNAVRSLANQFGLTVAMRETSTDVKQNRLTFWNGTYDQAMAWANDILTDMIEADAGAWDPISAFWIRAPGFGVDSYIILDYSSCVFTKFEIPPHYWTLRQVTKFVRPGAVRVGASVDSRNVRVAAFVDTRHQQTVIVIINNHVTQEQTATFRGVPNASLSVTQTTSTQNGAQLLPITVQGGQFTGNLPPRSVTTFVVGAVP